LKEEMKKIILRGFCNGTGNWMEYIIEKYKIEVKKIIE
jgi:hypothetical protein